VLKKTVYGINILKITLFGKKSKKTLEGLEQICNFLQMLLIKKQAEYRKSDLNGYFK
jgi:hypothetical protein